MSEEQKNPMKEFRARHKLSQKAAAEVLGYGSGRGIRYIEDGERPLSGTAGMAMMYYDILIEQGIEIVINNIDAT